MSLDLKNPSNRLLAALVTGPDGIWELLRIDLASYLDFPVETAKYEMLWIGLNGKPALLVSDNVYEAIEKKAGEMDDLIGKEKCPTDCMKFRGYQVVRRSDPKTCGGWNPNYMPGCTI